MNKNLLDLTNAERLQIWKRRNGYNQEEAASFCGCGKSVYGQMEIGVRPVEQYIKALNFALSVGKPTVQEQLEIARKRCDIEVKELATLLEVSKITLYKLLEKEDSRLIDFYIKQGFTLG